MRMTRLEMDLYSQGPERVQSDTRSGMEDALEDHREGFNPLVYITSRNVVLHALHCVRARTANRSTPEWVDADGGMFGVSAMASSCRTRTTNACHCSPPGSRLRSWCWRRAPLCPSV